MVKLPLWVKVLVFLTCWPAAVLAEDIPVYSHDEGATYIRLMPSQCVEGRSAMAIAMNLSEYADRAKAIDSVWGHKDGSLHQYAGCWVELTAEEAKHTEGVLILVFEDGMAFSVEKSKFGQPKGSGV
jgi:hypothetical protein